MLINPGWSAGLLGRFLRFSREAPKPPRRGICYLQNRGSPGGLGAGAGRVRQILRRTCAPKRVHLMQAHLHSVHATASPPRVPRTRSEHPQHSQPRTSSAGTRQLGLLTHSPATPQPARPLRRRPSRCVDTAHHRPAAWPLHNASPCAGTATSKRLPPGNRNPIAGARRRSCCCVDAMHTGRGCCDVRRAAQPGQLPFTDCVAR